MRNKFGIAVLTGFPPTFRFNMLPKFPVRVRAWCVAFALACGSIAPAAEPHPLMGVTREQVLSRYGEPKSTLLGASREILFYERERLTLRNGVVVEVERIAEPPRRVAPAAPPVPAPVEPAPSPATTVSPAPGGPSAPSPESKAAPVPTTEAGPAPTETVTPPPPEPKLAIKRVLPAGSTSTPTSKQDITPSDQSAAKGTPKTSTPAALPQSSVASGGPAAAPTVENITAPVPAGIPAPAASAPSSRPRSDAVTTPAEDEPPMDAATAGKKAVVKKVLEARAARRRLEQAEAEAEAAAEAVVPATSSFFNRTYIGGLVIIGAGIAFLLWRRQQRQIELAATAVSRAPFNEPLSARSGAIFTNDLIAKLEWKRFEELVAAYYSKTGVVATRTKSGPATPVNIKISWKGEQRPFALVHCIAQSSALVGPQPLQDLFAVLTAEDIRRGYVVTSGKFNVPARDFAEEKHITLLPSDIFLEKLNALPDAARAELMQEVTTGDYATPSCPKCEAKMVRSNDDPAVWRCQSHADQQVVAR